MEQARTQREEKAGNENKGEALFNVNFIANWTPLYEDIVLDMRLESRQSLFLIFICCTDCYNLSLSMDKVRLS